MRRTEAALAALALVCLDACARSPQARSGPAASETASACDRKLVSQADMAGVLSEPITSVAPLPGDAQSCVFRTASATSVTVSVRPGLGRATVDAWASGKTPLSASPLAGVGDQAVWQQTLHEVIAKKGDLLCDIGVAGPPSATAGATAAKVGALCAKIFAAGS